MSTRDIHSHRMIDGTFMTPNALQLEAAIESTLEPGRFIDYDASSDFVTRLHEVEAQLERLVDDGEAAAAVDLYELFIAACHEKIEEMDDSCGELGTFVGDLFNGWVRARQAVGATPVETIDILFRWMDDDPYGFCTRLGLDVVKVLDPDGLVAFATRVRARLELALATGQRSSEGQARYWTDSLKRILAAQLDPTGYLVLCNGAPEDPDDCETLANVHEQRGEAEAALSWVERGLDLIRQGSAGSGSTHQLEAQQRKLLQQLGRADEAIDLSWQCFVATPSPSNYAAFMELIPSNDRDAWNAKAMTAVGRRESYSIIQLYIEISERERLAELLSRGDAAYRHLGFAAEGAAELLSASHPALAARIFQDIALAILGAKRSRRYDEAVVALERARDCYVAANQGDEWVTLVAVIRRDHHRKGMMDAFERVVAGGSGRRSSFLERARKRWSKYETG